MSIVRRTVVALTVAPLAAVACSSGDAAETGVEVIEGELTEQIGLGPLAATCDQPDESQEGVEFACTALTEDDRRIEFTAVFETDSRIFVYPTNVVAGDVMPSVEAEAAQILGPEVGVTIDPSAIDCPDENTILDPDAGFTCAITDAATGEVYDLVATFTDFDYDEGFRSRVYEIVEPAAG